MAISLDHLKTVAEFEQSEAQLAVNALTSEEKEMVSDGYHTFGELYEHRLFLFVALCNFMEVMWPINGEPYKEEYRVWKSRKHSDGSEWNGWFIAGIGTEPGKTLTYHLPNRLWEHLDVEELDKAPEWDGHTSNDVLLRLAEKFFIKQ